MAGKSVQLDLIPLSDMFAVFNELSRRQATKELNLFNYLIFSRLKLPEVAVQ